MANFEKDFIEKVYNRIKEYAKISNYDEIGEKIGVGKRQILKLKSIGDLPLGYIVNWAIANKVSMDWVLYGEAKEISQNEPLPEGFLKIPYYPDIKASAGGGCTNGECADQNIRYITVDGSSIPAKANKKRLFALKAIGDSMADNIKDGALLICDGADKTFENGKIFIVNAYGETLVKRLFRPKTEDSIIIKSDNPYYGEEELPATAVEIIAKVVRFYNGANV